MCIKDTITVLEDALAELGLSFIPLLKNILLAGFYMVWIIFSLNFLFSLPPVSGAQCSFEKTIVDSAVKGYVKVHVDLI